MNKKLGEKIRQLRVLTGLSQENLAEELGMSHGNFGKIERGEIGVNSDKLIQIARILKVSPAELFEDKKQSVKENKPDYGFATKEEVSLIAEMVEKLAKEFEKFRIEFGGKKISKRKAVKSGK